MQSLVLVFSAQAIAASAFVSPQRNAGLDRPTLGMPFSAVDEERLHRSLLEAQLKYASFASMEGLHRPMLGMSSSAVAEEQLHRSLLEARLKYASSASMQNEERDAVFSALLDRRTVNDFDEAKVPDGVFRSAVETAVAAPCHKMTEPWRFIHLGPRSIRQIATLNAAAISEVDPEKGAKKKARWERIPGWCVVTSAKSPDDEVLDREDYAATCCAVQNFMLAMWAEGVGTKWTSGPITRTEEFADVCGINLAKEHVVGCIWYGYASGGLSGSPKPKRKRMVDDVLCTMP